MKLIILLLVLNAAQTFALTEQQLNKIVGAIWVSEGGEKAKVPYGILSVRVRNKAEAKRVCENTVRNNWRRWVESGKRTKFIDYLASRYTPISSDRVGHYNWIRNVRALSGLDL